MKRKCKQWWSTMPLISTKERFCRFEPVPGFPTLYFVVFILVSDLEVLVSLLILMILLTIMAERLSFHNHISHIIVKYKKYYWLNIFMVCKLQHGKIERIWYLQIKKACQVVECAFLDGCNLIRMKITTKYKIVLNTMTIWIPIIIRTVGRQHLC